MMSLSECLSAVSRATPPDEPLTSSSLEALDLWLKQRGDATISVGILQRPEALTSLRRCSVMAHDRTFEAERWGGGYATTWAAICAAVQKAESFEAAHFPGVG